MIPLLLSALLLWVLLRLFATLETEHGFLRVLVIATGITVAGALLPQMHPLLPLILIPPLLALVLWKWCLLPPGRAVIVAVVFLGCRVAVDMAINRTSAAAPVRIQ